MSQPALRSPACAAVRQAKRVPQVASPQQPVPAHASKAHASTSLQLASQAPASEVLSAGHVSHWKVRGKSCFYA